MFYKVKRIFDSLADEKSKELFLQRLRYNLTDNKKDLESIIKYSFPSRYDENNSLLSDGEFYKNGSEIDLKKRWVIYGAKVYGELIYNRYRFDRADVVFCDRNYREIKNYCGKPVISPDDLLNNYTDANVFIASTQFHDEIYKFLRDNKVANERILTNNILKELGIQYFEPFVEFYENEVFIDVGVLDGESSLLFAEKCGQNYEKIYLFEPDNESYERSIENLEKNKLDNYQIFNLGLWNEKATLSFNSTGGRDAAISDTGDCEVLVDSLDNILGDKRVTYIKMDIEGSELNALIGASNIIKTQKPKLAICIYHKPSDILDIPNCILELAPDYKLYIRMHSVGPNELVLYAIPPKS